MPAIINTNIASLNSQRNLQSSQSALQVSLQRLSSGLRINSAKDDAAGLAISERFSTQIRGLNQAARNANDGISLAQTGEGALASVTDNLQRIRELAVQAANSTNSAGDRAAINLEVLQRLAEIDRTASQTSFNGQKLLDGSFANANFQIGANAGEVISVDLAASNVRNSNIGAVATKTSNVLGATATGGSATTGAITAGNFSTPSSPASAGTLTLNPATRNFGTAAVAFAGGSTSTNTVATTNFSVAGTALTSGRVEFTASDFNFQALIAGKSDPMTVTSFDNDGTSALIAGYNSQVPTNLDFSGAALAQFNVTDGANTASITLNSAFTTMTALAAELQTQVQASGGNLTTSTVSYNASTGGLLFTNVGQTTALQVTSVDTNAISHGFAASAGVTGAAANSVASFTVDGSTMTMAAGGTTITDFATDLNTQIQASGTLADKANYLAEVQSGKIVITHAGSTVAVAIGAPNAKALASGIVASAGVTGTASSNPSTMTIDSKTVTLNQNYLSYANMASDIGVQMGAGYTVTSTLTGVGNTLANFTISRTTTGAGSAAIDITGDAASTTAGITAGGGNTRAGIAGTDLVASTVSTFTVGGTSPVTLNQSYADRTAVKNALQSQLAGYNVTDTGTGYEITSLTSSAPVTISGANAAAITAGFVNSAGDTGTAAVSTTNATFTIDTKTITLNTDFASYDAMATGVGGLQSKLDGQFGAGVYTVSNNAGAITIAKVATGVGSTAPDITVADAASTAAGLGTVSGTSVNGANAVTGTNVNLTVNGQAISLVGNNSTLTDVQGNLQSALNAAFTPSAYTVTLSGTGLKVTNNTLGSAAVSVTADNAAATAAGFGNILSTAAGVGSGSVSLSDLTINGTSLAGSYASSAALATAINNTVNGVYATVNNGALTLTSSAAMTLAGPVDTAATGLTAGTVAANSGSLLTAAVDTTANANMTIQRIDSALNTVSTLRSTFGAIQNRFESVITSLTATSENLTAARSRIQDTDFAAETAQLTRNQILQQAGTAMLAQANQLPNTVLSLLR